MFVFFLGGVAAFSGGMIKINDETGGPTKHSPIDVDKISQRDKLLQQKAAMQ